MQYERLENFSADEIRELIDKHTQTLAKLKELLPKKCAAEGHKWGPVNQRYTVVGYEPSIIQHEVDYGFGGPKRVPIYGDLYRRDCTRCGCVDARQPKVTKSNPFESEP